MLLKALCLVLIGVLPVAHASSAKAPLREWNFLVFLNGHNNLDSFGKLNINQMETVGSTDDINVLVQWASSKNEKTQRLLVTKDNDSVNVTSPIVQELPRVDMGDWQEAVKFAQWANEKYPAKRTFFVIWNHGGGWHRKGLQPGMRMMDISNDDFTHHIISTVQMGQIGDELKKLYGKPVDIYGLDACLMGMAEVGNEIASGTDVMVASEEVEPGAGWPYDKFLERWVKNPRATSEDITKILNDEYVKSYAKGFFLARSVGLSSTKLNESERLNTAIRALSAAVLTMNADDLKKFKAAMELALPFYFRDYRDLGDLVVELEKTDLKLKPELDGIKNAMRTYVIDSQVSPGLIRATGVSIWVPSNSYSFNLYSDRYGKLKFAKDTRWNEALAHVYKN